MDNRNNAAIQTSEEENADTSVGGPPLVLQYTIDWTAATVRLTKGGYCPEDRLTRSLIAEALGSDTFQAAAYRAIHTAVADAFRARLERGDKALS